MYVLFLPDMAVVGEDFVHVLQVPPHQISYRQNECTTWAPQASAHMYINAVIKPTEDWKQYRGSAMKFVASKIIFFDSFDGAGILSRLIGLLLNFQRMELND